MGGDKEGPKTQPSRPRPWKWVKLLATGVTLSPPGLYVHLPLRSPLWALGQGGTLAHPTLATAIINPVNSAHKDPNHRGRIIDASGGGTPEALRGHPCISSFTLPQCLCLAGTSTPLRKCGKAYLTLPYKTSFPSSECCCCCSRQGFSV